MDASVHSLAKVLLNFQAITICLSKRSFKAGMFYRKEKKYRRALLSCLTVMLLLSAGQSFGQHYNALHGSDYSGGLAVYNNPASIVQSFHKWDFTPLALQFQGITNAVKGRNFPFYFSPEEKFHVAEGNFPREADLNYNIRLFNTRISIDKNHAFAFGLNLRGYSQAATSRIHYSDSVIGPRSFLALNEQNRSVSMNFTSSAWMEVYGAYGLTVWDRETSRLNAGATLKIQRGLSGAFVRLNEVGVQRVVENDFISYRVTDGGALYGYSANHGNGNSFQAADVFSQSQLGFAADLGVEYLVKPQAVTTIFDEDDYYDYEWKLGFSLLDLGWNNYLYGSESRNVSKLSPDVTNNVLQQKFRLIDDLSSFNDSLATIVQSSEQLSGNFSISNPTRAVINIDRYVSGHIFVNGELSLNLTSVKDNKISVQESKLLTVTPRWEKRKLGFYLPAQYNRYGNFWIGGAVRVGPLLLGTHNLLNIFAKNQNIRGGAYLALTFRPSNFLKNPVSRQYDCPE